MDTPLSQGELTQSESDKSFLRHHAAANAAESSTSRDQAILQIHGDPWSKSDVSMSEEESNSSLDTEEGLSQDSLFEKDTREELEAMKKVLGSDYSEDESDKTHDQSSADEDNTILGEGQNYNSSISQSMSEEAVEDEVDFWKPLSSTADNLSSLESMEVKVPAKRPRLDSDTSAEEDIIMFSQATTRKQGINDHTFMMDSSDESRDDSDEKMEVDDPESSTPPLDAIYQLLNRLKSLVPLAGLDNDVEVQDAIKIVRNRTVFESEIGQICAEMKPNGETIFAQFRWEQDALDLLNFGADRLVDDGKQEGKMEK